MGLFRKRLKVTTNNDPFSDEIRKSGLHVPSDKEGVDAVNTSYSSRGQKTVTARKEKAWELGKTVHLHQIAQLAEYLEDESIEVRRAAVSSLEQQWPTGDSIGILLLTERLDDSDPQIRATSAMALGEFIPRNCTPGARKQGIEALMKLLEKEDTEDVLGRALAALGNIDDSGILPSFTATMEKLNKPVIYIGIREIDKLRPTKARQEMISSLRAIEAKLDNSSDAEGAQARDDYQGRRLVKQDIAVLAELEKLTGMPIPFVNSVIWNTYGALVEDKKVVELGIYKKNLSSLPENFGQLTSLRTLWMTDNHLKALPDSFGSLKSLKKLLMQGNEITSLPNSIVNLDNLQFLRLDEKAITHISEDVAKWLEKQKEKLGQGAILWD